MTRIAPRGKSRTEIVGLSQQPVTAVKGVTCFNFFPVQSEKSEFKAFKCYCFVTHHVFNAKHSTNTHQSTCTLPPTAVNLGSWH